MGPGNTLGRGSYGLETFWTPDFLADETKNSINSSPRNIARTTVRLS